MHCNPLLILGFELFFKRELRSSIKLSILSEKFVIVVDSNSFLNFEICLLEISSKFENFTFTKWRFVSFEIM